MMRSYLRMMLFALGLLAGVQIPGLVDLYFQRLDARLQQAGLALAPSSARRTSTSMAICRRWSPITVPARIPSSPRMPPASSNW